MVESCWPGMGPRAGQWSVEGLWCKADRVPGTMSPSDLQDDCELFSDGRWWMKRREKNIWINIRIHMSSSL